MSCYLTIDRLKKVIEENYFSKRRSLMELKDKSKRVVIVIDDLHLQGNLKCNVLEFIRTWCTTKGYFDLANGLFKNIKNIATIMAENSDYRKNYCKAEGKEPLNSRFLFYSNTLY